MASFSVVTNSAAHGAQAYLAVTSSQLLKTLQRVSSGLRINASGDDAAGLAVANTYRSAVTVISQGVRNANDGLSDLQVKDGALDNISKLLDRLATLATQAATGHATTSTRDTLNAEFGAVLDEITREAGVAGIGVAATGFSVFVSNHGAGGVIAGQIGRADATGLGLTACTLTSRAAAESAVSGVTSAIALLGSVQAEVGQLQNRLAYATALAQSQLVNNRAAESRLRDANIAEEAASLARFSILNESGLASLAQANTSAVAVLALLQ
jgi:flagellin